MPEAADPRQFPANRVNREPPVSLGPPKRVPDDPDAPKREPFPWEKEHPSAKVLADAKERLAAAEAAIHALRFPPTETVPEPPAAHSVVPAP